MVIGIIFTVILTSTMTNAFGGFDHLDISKKQVIAVEGSMEAWIAAKINQAKVINLQTYELLFEQLSKRQHNIGVVDTHVRSYYQSRYSSLRSIKMLPAGSTILTLYSKSRYNSTMAPIINCLESNITSVFDNTIADHFQLLQKTYANPDVEIDFEEFLSDPVMRTVLIIAGIMISLSLLFEVTSVLRRLLTTRIFTVGETGRLSTTNHGRSDFDEISIKK